MAAEVNISLDDDVFRGELVPLEFTAEDMDLSTAELLFIVKKFERDTTSILEKSTDQGSPSPIVVSGTWNPDPELNTQIVTVMLNPEDTFTEGSPDATLTPGKYRYALVRTDTDQEAVLFVGDLWLKRSAAW